MDPKFWDEMFSAKEYFWAGEPNEFVKTHTADLKPGDAIDLAAGEGRNAVWLASQGWRVKAVDFSQVGLDKGARLASDHGVTVEFVNADATTYQPSELVDLIVISYLQIPIAPQQVVLKHAGTWLRVGGTILVIVGGTILVIAHDESNLTQGYGGPPSAEISYTVERTVQAFDGLDIVIAEVAKRTVDTPAGPQVALDTLVVATRVE